MYHPIRTLEATTRPVPIPAEPQAYNGLLPFALTLAVRQTLLFEDALRSDITNPTHSGTTSVDGGETNDYLDDE